LEIIQRNLADHASLTKYHRETSSPIENVVVLKSTWEAL